MIGGELWDVFWIEHCKVGDNILSSMLMIDGVTCLGVLLKWWKAMKGKSKDASLAFGQGLGRRNSGH